METTEEPAVETIVAAPKPPTPATLADPHRFVFNGRTIFVRNSRILVYMPDHEDDVTTHSSGILIPRKYKDREPDGSLPGGEEMEEGLILAIGEGRYNSMTGEFAGCNYSPGNWVWVVTVGGNERFIDKFPESDSIMFMQEDLVRAIVDAPQPHTAPGEDPDAGQESGSEAAQDA